MRYSNSDSQFTYEINQVTSIPYLIEFKEQLEQSKLHEISRQYANQNVTDMYIRSIEIVEDRIKYLTEHSADKSNSI